MYIEPVLIVDDDPIFSVVAAEALKARGIKAVHIADCGSDGLEIVSQSDEKPGLIILDLQMPKLDGLAFMRELSALNFGGQILIVSGEEGGILKSALNFGKMLDANIVGALKKPLDDMQLDAALARCSEINSMKKTINSLDSVSDMSKLTLVPFYQPQFHISDRTLSGAEALTRIARPDGQFLPPHGYFERIRNTEQAKTAAITTMSNVFADIAEWQFDGFDCDFAVNIDAPVVEEPGLVEEICDLAREFAIETGTVAIELTETALPKQMNRLLESLTRLRLAGFRLSIDDYGTGGANFDMLRMCPFTELKIDMSIIQSMEFDPISRHFFDTTVELAQNIGLKTVAEGIETEEQLAMVTDRGVDIGQGYLFGKAEPKSSLSALLAKYESTKIAS